MGNVRGEERAERPGEGEYFWIACGQEIKLQSLAGEQEGGSKPRLAGRQDLLAKIIICCGNFQLALCT